MSGPRYTKARRFYRRPKGKRQALLRGDRHGAIPPDAWDDIPIGKENWLPIIRACQRMGAQGLAHEEIATKLSAKFKIPMKWARQTVSIWASN